MASSHFIQNICQQWFDVKETFISDISIYFKSSSPNVNVTELIQFEMLIISDDGDDVTDHEYKIIQSKSLWWQFPVSLTCGITWSVTSRGWVKNLNFLLK